jgi:UDP-glucose 4-epimerase
LVGGRGFLGGYLARQLELEGRETFFVDGPAELKTLLKSEGAGFQIFFLAHRGHPGVPAQSEVHQASLDYFSVMLESLQTKPPESLILFSSGGAIYGPANSQPILESRVCHPICAYGMTKQKMEQKGQEWAQKWGVRFLILRPGNAYGPGQEKRLNAAGFPAAVVRAILTQGDLKLYGRPGALRDYIHAEDVAEGALQVAMHGQDRNAYHLATGRALSLHDVLSIFKDASPNQVKNLRITEESHRVCDVREVCLSPEKTFRETGWRPRVSLEAGIRAWLGSLAKSPSP